MTIKSEYEYGDIVYLRTDVEQLPRIVIGINARQAGVRVVITCGTQDSEHYPFELSKTRDILMSLNIDQGEVEK